jgi:hypothetical protein
MTNLALILASTGSNPALLTNMAPPSTPDLGDVLQSAEARVIAVTLAHIADETKRNADAIISVSESLRMLASIESQQRHVIESLKEGSIRMTDHEKRLQLVEQNLPALLEMRKWVVTGVLAGVGMMGAALVKLVIVDVPRFSYPQPPAAVAPAQPVQK